MERPPHLLGRRPEDHIGCGTQLFHADLERWRGREAELEADEQAKAAYRSAAEQGDLAVIPVWASQAVDLITEVVPADDLVGSLVAEAEAALARTGRALE